MNEDAKVDCSVNSSNSSLVVQVPVQGSRLECGTRKEAEADPPDCLEGGLEGGSPRHSSHGNDSALTPSPLVRHEVMYPSSPLYSDGGSVVERFAENTSHSGVCEDREEQMQILTHMVHDLKIKLAQATQVRTRRC